MDTFNTGQGRTYLQRKRPYVEVPLGSDTEDYKNRRNKFSQDVNEIKSDSRNNPGPFFIPSLKLARLSRNSR
jgi:hypothetical protein